ncbi:formylglycine-generating enzyme family protein [Floridanema evergladense]|uniref:Formylglycine-generating enzyme family protein n=1 Tax=Floridaenema evergladense BLCC-F167 TaxID=3153639 RepID=A0ABV4WSY9_9CYAN
MSELPIIQKTTGIMINRFQREAKYFVEDLGAGVELYMVLIPGGSFMMGSPENEQGHNESESPQHQVTVTSFFLGKYPVTQTQWKAVAALPKVNKELRPNPSRFIDDNRPVECVSWYDAVEFCTRLSQKSTREYRLPSEAEWEYACRAGTTTPFHFGETITTDFANYRGTDDEKSGWSGSYNQGPKGIYRAETTPVGSFDIANAFGLYDMHGNVWEWCADHWHSNYESAPNDGSIWLSDNETSNRLLRGGSWLNNPENCRSAYRYDYYPGNKIDDFGFRVVCAAAKCKGNS